MDTLKRINLAVGWLIACVWAREVPVRYFLDDGAEHSAVFVKLQNDSVYVRSTPTEEGQEPVESVLYKLEVRRMVQVENDSLVNLDLKDFVFPDPVIEEVHVEPPYPAGHSFIKVTSEPEASRVYINGKDLSVLTPYVIPNVREGKYEVSVRKYLKDVDWWGSQKIKLKENETLSVHIKVERPRTELTIVSLPEAAEVYVDDEPSLYHMPPHYTDVTIKGIRPQLSAKLHFRKVGYLDTAITTEIVAFMPNMVYVEMEPIRDNLAMLEMQNEFNQKRKKKWIGRGLLWGSIAPFLAGGVLWYFAERDWEKAADFKEKYNRAAFQSAQTDSFIADNKSYNESGDTKMIVGASLGALGLALASVGVVFQF